MLCLSDSLPVMLTHQIVHSVTFRARCGRWGWLLTLPAHCVARAKPRHHILACACRSNRRHKIACAWSLCICISYASSESVKVTCRSGIGYAARCSWMQCLLPLMPKYLFGLRWSCPRSHAPPMDSSTPACGLSATPAATPPTTTSGPGACPRRKATFGTL